MRRVRRLGPTPAFAHFQIVLLYDIVEAVIADAVRRAETLVVHSPQLAAADTWIPPADFLDEFHDEGFRGKALHQPVFMLVEGLLTNTK